MLRSILINNHALASLDDSFEVHHEVYNGYIENEGDGDGDVGENESMDEGDPVRPAESKVTHLCRLIIFYYMAIYVRHKD